MTFSSVIPCTRASPATAILMSNLATPRTSDVCTGAPACPVEERTASPVKNVHAFPPDEETTVSFHISSVMPFPGAAAPGHPEGPATIYSVPDFLSTSVLYRSPSFVNGPVSETNTPSSNRYPAMSCRSSAAGASCPADVPYPDRRTSTARPAAPVSGISAGVTEHEARAYAASTAAGDSILIPNVFLIFLQIAGQVQCRSLLPSLQKRPPGSRLSCPYVQSQYISCSFLCPLPGFPSG